MENLWYGLKMMVIGLAIVFLILAVLILCIWLLSKGISRLDGKSKARAQKKAAVEETPVAEVAAPVVLPEEPVDETDNAELVAVIMAAIAAFDANAAKNLVVKSVRRIDGWRRARCTEQVYKF